MRARILVIDDEESIRFSFERFLDSAGYSVTTARNCNEAVARIDEGNIDLVFTDIILPDGTGIDLLRDIKLKMPACRVIMITAYPSVETARDVFKMGAFDYLTKPVRQQTVLGSVTMALQSKQNGKGGEEHKV